MSPVESGDPFDTARLRGLVLDSWAASAARFREDANAEEDLALGGYRDRVVVELAQNAADSAERAGVPGRLLLRLRDGVLVAANTGAALDAAGVEALSTLRASSKRDSRSVGRFGVGFAAVLAVSDDPAIGSRTSAAVRWSRADAREAVASAATSSPALSAELGRRGVEVPVLRLPFAGRVDVPEGYDTAVVLPLKESAPDVRRLLDEVPPALLLALPALAEIAVETGNGRRVLAAAPDGDDTVLTVDGVPVRWTTVRRTVPVDPAVLGDRPLEERSRTTISVLWALPPAGEPLPGVLLAPTPTDEPLGLPALLVATMPLEPTRRRTAPGRLRDAVAREAGSAYAELVSLVAATSPARALALLPGPVGPGEVDGLIRAAALAALPDAAFVQAAVGRELLAPRQSVVVDDAPPAVLVELSDALDGVATADAVRVAGLLERLGARRVPLAEAIDALAGRRREPGQWQALYAALASAPTDALGAVPVPLADGRVVRGARGTVVVGAASDAELRALEVLGVRVVEPAAAHPLLERLGALRTSGAAALLTGPEVEGALGGLDSMDDEAAHEIAGAVLQLVAADPGAARELDLGGLLLSDDEGELASARELLLPDSALEGVVHPDSLGRVDPGLVERWGREVLAAVGVLDGFGLLPVSDLVLDPDETELEVDDLDGWMDEVAPGSDAGLPSLAPEALLVRDLDLVADSAWPQALAILSRPPYRAAVVDPLRVLGPLGGSDDVVPYAAWWLRKYARVDDMPLTAYAVGDDPLLRRLFDTLPFELDREFAAAIGVRRALADLLQSAEGAADLLHRLADDSVVLDRATLREVYAGLAASPLPEVSDLPTGIRVVDGGSGTKVVAADRALVLDAPDLLPLLESSGLVVVPRSAAVAIANLLQIGLVSEELDVPAPVGGTVREVPGLVRAALPESPSEWVEHERIVVAGVDLPWRFAAGQVHACTLDGLARGLAWAADRWSARGLVAELLLSPESAGTLFAESDLEA